MKQFNVGILGATGAVGQKFINLNARDIPWLYHHMLWGRSERSGRAKSYAEAVNWIEAVELPDAIASMTVTRLFTSFYERCRFCLLGPGMLLWQRSWKVTWPGPVFRLFPTRRITAPIRMYPCLYPK